MSWVGLRLQAEAAVREAEAAGNGVNIGKVAGIAAGTKRKAALACIDHHNMQNREMIQQQEEEQEEQEQLTCPLTCMSAAPGAASSSHLMLQSYLPHRLVSQPLFLCDTP